MIPATALLAATLLPGAAVASEATPRTASINLCSDVLLLALLPRERIVSLSWLAAESPLSPVREQARGLPVNHAASEELILQRPDLVIAQRGHAVATLQRLRERGIRVYQLPAVSTLAGAFREWRALGEALGREQQAEAMIRQARARLAALPDRQALSPTAVILGPGGYSYGKGSLAHDLLRLAGWDNLAGYVLPGYGGSLPLEALLLGQPDLILMERQQLDAGRVDTVGDRLLRHSMFASLAAEQASMSPAGWTCPGPQLLDTVEGLAALRAQR